MTEIVILFGTALVTAWVFRQVHAPTIIGYLITGILLGPSGIDLIQIESVGGLSEIGLILLLFIVGLELSPGPLMRLGSAILMSTGIQITVTAGFTAALVWLVGGLPILAASILGIAVALSSTAIVLKQLSDRGETSTVYGLITTAILLLQDIIVILVMLLLPLLAATGGEANAGDVVLRTGISLVLLAVIAVAARAGLPFFIKHVVRSGGSELLVLFAVLMACGGAWLASLADWSPALGACIAGLLLAEADERHQLAADIMPFRDVFNAIFFITLGVRVHLDLVLPYAGLLVAAIVVTLLGKTIVTTGAVLIGRWPFRPALQVGLGLATVSEFGYVLAHEAARAGVLPENILEVFITYAVGTMMAGAVLVPLSAPIAEKAQQWLPGYTPPDDSDAAKATSKAHHVIIVGYGLTGENMHKVLEATRIPHCIVEMNPRLVAEARAAKAEVIVGDATRLSILDHAGLSHAHAMVIAINDPQATQGIITKSRQKRRDLFILARTRFVEELDNLYRLGADQVIPEDFETSVEIAANILKEMNIPDNIVDAQIAAIRAGRYGMLRGLTSDRTSQEELIQVLNLTATRSHYLQPGRAACGKTLVELNIRAITGVTIIAVMRGGKPEISPGPAFRLETGDVLIMVGSHAQLESARAFLESEAGGDSETSHSP